MASPNPLTTEWVPIWNPMTLDLGTMAAQNATAVTITGGSIALGGAGTGLATLSVRSPAITSDSLFVPLRLYPHATAAGATTVGARIETPTVAGAGSIVTDVGIQILPRSASVAAIGIQIVNPAVGGTVYGYQSLVTAGTNRWNFYAEGSAPNFMAGWLGVGKTPGRPVDIFGEVRAHVFSTMAGQVGPNAVGYYSNIPAGTNNWNFHIDGDAPNYFLGPITIGGAPEPGKKLTVHGDAWFWNSLLATTLSCNTLTVNTGATVSNPTIYGTATFNGSSYFNQPLQIRYAKNTQWGAGFVPSDNDTGGGGHILFYNFALAAVGTIQSNASSTFYNTGSDVRLKDQLEPLTDALSVVTSLRPLSFRWRADGSRGQGFLAHEVQALVPQAISGEPGAVNAKGDIMPQFIDHSKLVVWLTGALQEVAQQVTTLSARLATLEGALP